MTAVVLVPTGTANIASVKAALHRLGVEPVEAVRPEDVSEASQVVLPGVGSFGAAMAAIDSLGMRDALQGRVESGRPTLAVCVGMQLLGSTSTESPGSIGLGVIPFAVERFENEVRVPQLGWNLVEPEGRSRFIEPGWAYFANSYRIASTPEGWVGATSEYGGRFVSALERGSVLAVQFHPELSGPWGAAVLRRWLSATREAA